MSLPCEKCCKTERGSVVVRSEKGKRFEIRNRQRRVVKVCRVDGYLLRENGKKCDYLFLLEGRALLVELKGKDRNRALQQLIESAEKLRSNRFKGRVETYIVSSKVPSADTLYQRELKRLHRRFQVARCSAPTQKNIVISVNS